MIPFIPLVAGVDPGYLPGFFNQDDPRPAREQINAAYAHGGGWRPMKGWAHDPVTRSIQYVAEPGDPPLEPLAVAALRDEVMFLYRYEWLAIFQKDGSFEIARVN
jgi:hypothetical protein